MIYKFMIPVVVSVLFFGCSHFNVKEIDSVARQNTDIDYSAEDLHDVTLKMVESMLKNRLFDGSIVIDVRGIENRTYEHIDTEAITDGIKVAISKSGRAKFIDSGMRNQIHKELSYQSKSLYTDKNHVKKIGKEIVPDYILVGKITSIKQRNGDLFDNFYKVTLELHSVQTGQIVWIDSKEKRKIGKRAMIGW